MILKQALGKCKLTIGSWMTIGDCSIAEIMAKTGFDWLVIDMEHSSIDFGVAQNLIRTIDLAGGTPLVRVGENSPYLIKRVMDAGAHGVIVPNVNSIEEAEKAVSAAKYSPEGTRGVGLARAQNYGLGFEKYKEWQKKNATVIVQIEHYKAMDELEGILKTPGVDATMIGPYDLSASLGFPGNFQKKEMKDFLEKYLKVSKKVKKACGIHVIPPEAEEVKKVIKKGYNFIVFSFDAMFIGQKIKDEIKSVR